MFLVKIDERWVPAMSSMFPVFQSVMNGSFPIEKAYPALEAEYKRLELDKNLSVEARNLTFAHLILSWGAVVEEVRTIFEKRNDATIYIPDMQSI